MLFKMKIMVLGSGGFLGKALVAKLEDSHQLLKVNRQTDLVDLFNSAQFFDFVINCASSSAKANLAESHESNFLYPKQIFKNLYFSHWVQIESYFQLQIPFGRLDPYTIEKERFSRFLDENVRHANSPQVYHLYMPHLFGDNDRPERLISSAISALSRGEIFQTSSGTQFLPVLYISDAVEGILRFIERPTENAACRPFWYGSVKDLLDLMASQFSKPPILYGLIPDPVDADFPRVDFPQSVDGWVPKMQLVDFLEWIKMRRN